jgi:hypothetical protein
MLFHLHGILGVADIFSAARLHSRLAVVRERGLQHAAQLS